MPLSQRCWGARPPRPWSEAGPHRDVRMEGMGAQGWHGAGTWWAMGHPNSYLLCHRHVCLVGSSLCRTWHPRHPLGDPSTALGVGGRWVLFLIDLGPSVRLGSWAFLLINFCCFKNNVEMFLVSGGAFTSHSPRAGLQKEILE